MVESSSIFQQQVMQSGVQKIQLRSLPRMLVCSALHSLLNHLMFYKRRIKDASN